MKKSLLLLTGMFLFAFVFAQPAKTESGNINKIKLTNGQNITVESSSTIEASLAMGMELTSNSASVNSLIVKNSSGNNYSISNTLTKLKVDMNMMGQPNNYDSENKDSNSGEMAKVLDEKINKTTDITIDKTTGLAIVENKKNNKADEEDSNTAAGLMNIFNETSDEGIVSGAFEIIPQGKLVGDNWSDTLTTKDLKIMRTYTLKSLTGGEAVIQMDIKTKAVNKLDFQGMEFEIKTESKTKGEIFTDAQTSLVKKKTSISEITGTLQMMGQDMPINATVNTTSIYK